MVRVNSVLLSSIAIVSIGASEPAYPGDSTHPLASNKPSEAGIFDSLSPKNVFKQFPGLASVDPKNPSPEISSPIDTVPKDPVTTEKNAEIKQDMQASADDNSPFSDISNPIDAELEESETTKKNTGSNQDIQASVDAKHPSSEIFGHIDVLPEESENTEKSAESTLDNQTSVDSVGIPDNQSREIIPDISGEAGYLSAIGDVVKENAVAIGAATLTAAFATWFFTPSEEGS